MKINFARFRFLPIAATLVALAGCGGSAGKDAAPSGAIAITVTEDGFEPAVVRAAAGQPVHLVVTRKTDKTCATEFVMAEHQINQPLPLDQPVNITFTPGQAGELHYACGMNMYKGTIVVE
jgi:plastocyanin domain-containing protein